MLLNQKLIEFGRNHGIKYTITCDAHYLDKDHAKYHDFMLAIKDKKAVDDPDRFRYGVQDMYLKTDEEIERIARSEYNLIKPHEEAYYVVPVSTDEMNIPGIWPFN